MKDVVIGILFAACGVGIHLLLKDVFSRDESSSESRKSRIRLYRWVLALEGLGCLPWFSAFKEKKPDEISEWSGPKHSLAEDIAKGRSHIQSDHEIWNPQAKMKSFKNPDVNKK